MIKFEIVKHWKADDQTKAYLMVSCKVVLDKEEDTE